jgi:hypothetical protein
VLGQAPIGDPRTVEHWRGETLPMGPLYEGAAVDFWSGIVANAGATARPGAGRHASAAIIGDTAAGEPA